MTPLHGSMSYVATLLATIPLLISALAAAVALVRATDHRVSQLAAEVDILTKVPAGSDAAKALEVVVEFRAAELQRTVHHKRDLEAVFGGSFLYFVLALIAITLINVDNRWTVIAAVPVAAASLLSLLIALRGFEKVPRRHDGRRIKGGDAVEPTSIATAREPETEGLQGEPADRV